MRAVLSYMRRWLAGPRDIRRWSVVAIAVVLMVPPARAGNGSDVARVEEDWEAVLDQPNGGLTAPQFHTVMSPTGDVKDLYMQLSWNYRELPDFRQGGLQIQAWSGESYLGRKDHGESPISSQAETISWTQRLETDGSRITFSVQNGTSASWGSFGGNHLGLGGTYPLANLNGYSVDISVSNSWITYGANRVQLLRIKEVRRYDSNGNLISRDSSSRTVYEHTN